MNTRSLNLNNLSQYPLLVTLLVIVAGVALGTIVQDAGTTLIGLFLSIPIGIYLLKNPMISLGISIALVMTGGFSQLLQGTIFSRLYTIFFVVTTAAFVLQNLEKPKVIRSWFKLRSTDFFLLSLTFIAFISFGASDYLSVSISQFTTLGKGILLYLLVSRVITTKSELLLVIKIMFLGSFAQALFTWTDAGQRALLGGDQIVRLSSNLENANSLAGFLLVIVPWTLYLSQYSQSKLFKLLGYAGIFIFPLAIMATVSRGGILVLGALFALWFLLIGDGLKRRAILVLIAGIVLSVGFSVYGASLLRRWATLGAYLGYENLSYIGSSDGERTLLWQATLQVIERNWLLGTGIGTSSLYIGPLAGLTDRLSHNMYLGIAADIGVIGLVTFVSVIAVAYKQLAAAFVTHFNSPERAIIVAQTLAFTAWVLFGIINNREYLNYAYFLIAVSSILPTILPQLLPKERNKQNLEVDLALPKINNQ